MQDIGLVANVLYYLLLLVCGVNYPITKLPSWLQWFSLHLPLTNGLMAARLIIDGSTDPKIYGLILREGITGLAYFTIGYAFFAYLEIVARRKGTLALY